jgi:hypothetical protein
MTGQNMKITITKTVIEDEGGIKLSQQETFYLLRAIHYFEANLKHFSEDSTDLDEVLCSLLNLPEMGLHHIRQIRTKAENSLCPTT